MSYDFSTLPDRAGHDALAWEIIPVEGASVREGFSTIPMWVADMNFATVPAVPAAITERASHPIYGYFLPREEYHAAIIDWQHRRHGITGLSTEHIGYENGVLGGVISALGAISSPGDQVLLHSPTYIGFTNSLKSAGYRITLSPLRQDGEGVWRMDFVDMEEKLRGGNIHAAILCSPHNPAGRVWERWELEQAMELYRKYDVYVISDEIWADLTLFGHKHIPTQSVSEDAKHRTVALYAPSKTFNLAGLVGSYHIIYDRWLRDRVRKIGAQNHYNNMNVLSMYALIAGYSQEGEQWLNELTGVLGDNVTFATDYIAAHFPGVHCAKPEGTYMLFLDCTAWCAAHSMTLDELLRRGIEVGVIWQDGRPFNGDCHIRMNLALPTAYVKEAFDRLDRYVFS